MKDIFKFFILLLGSVSYCSHSFTSDNISSCNYNPISESSKLIFNKDNRLLQEHLDASYYAAIEESGLTPKFDIRLQDGKKIWKCPQYLESLKRNYKKNPNNYFLDRDFVKGQEILLDECSQILNIPSPGSRKKKALELIARASYYKEINENNFLVCREQIEIVNSYILTVLGCQKTLEKRYSAQSFNSPLSQTYLILMRAQFENNLKNSLSRKNDLEYWFNEFLGHVLMSNHALALCFDLKDKSEKEELELMQQEIEMKNMESADQHSKIIEFAFHKRSARQLKKSEFKLKQKILKIEEKYQQADALKLQKEKEEFQANENRAIQALKIQEIKEKNKSAQLAKLAQYKAINQSKKIAFEKEKKLKFAQIEKKEKEEEELLAVAIEEVQKKSIKPLKVILNWFKQFVF